MDFGELACHSLLLPSSSWSRSTSRSSGKYSSWWWYWTQSPIAQRQLQNYEQRSLAVALRRMDGVQCCPFLIVAMRGSPMRSVVATNTRTSELRAIYGTPLPPPNPFRTIGWKPNISTWTVLLHSSRNGEERKGTVAAGHVLNVTSGFVACAVIRGTYRPPNLMQVDRAWACVRKYGTRY